MLYWPAGVVGDPEVAELRRSTNAKACTEPSRSMVGVVEISQQFHDLLWIDVAKIVKWEEWGHDGFYTYRWFKDRLTLFW